MLPLHQTDFRWESRTGLADGTAGAHRRKQELLRPHAFFSGLHNTFLFGFHVTVEEAS